MKNVSVLYLFCASFFVFWSCNESLPLYSAPENVLAVTIVPLNTPNDTVRYTMRSDNNPNLAVVNLQSPFNGYEIRFVNVYDETIQDDLEIDGTIELAWVDKPDLKAIVPISNTSFYGGDLNPVTGLLTVNPGDTVRLRAFWNFKLTTNDWAFSHVQYTETLAYYVGPFQFQSDRFHRAMDLRVTVRVKVFRSLSYIETQSVSDFPVLFKGTITYPP